MRGSFLPDFLPDFSLFEFLLDGEDYGLFCILNLQTTRSGMTSEVGMHLHFTVCPVRDDFAPGNASPFNEISSKGCIDDKNMDKINREESSLEENFYPQG